jgi:hypothetical protein
LPNGSLERIGEDTMNSHKVSRVLAFAAAVCIAGGLLCRVTAAQGPIPDAPGPSIAGSSFVSVSPVELPRQHRFWDKTNLALFTANAALSAVDFCVTRANLQSGGTELNPIVRIFGRSTPGLAVNFAGETAGVIGVSYFFHRTGHHRLERIASTVNIGGSATAAMYGLTHR